MPRAALRYAALMMLLAGAFLVRGTDAGYLIRILREAESVPAPPFEISPATRTISGGPLQGDQILAINSRPFNAAIQYADAVKSSYPGGTIRFTLSEPNGGAVEHDVIVPSQADAFKTISGITGAVGLNVLVPFIALGLGFAVVAIRPSDWNAWLVLFLMLGATETMATQSWDAGPVPDWALAWNAFWNSMWPTCMLLFGIYFPAQPAWDKRLPWIKYLLIAAFTVVNFGYWAIYLVWQHNINAAVARGGTFARLHLLKIVCLVVANGAFFANLRRKRGAELSPDARRRLDIIREGSWIGLGPVFLLGSYAVLIRRELFSHVAWPIALFALFFLLLFPLTIAYAIVVERAMDLRFIIRTIVKYSFAKTGLWLMRAFLIVLAINLFTASRPRTGISEIIELSTIGLGLLMLRQRGADRLSLWIDRKFFREAHDAERVLADLASEAGKCLEVQPLLQRIGLGVSQTLHVPDVVILLREGEMFRTAYSTRTGEPMDIPARSRIAAKLREGGEPLEIDFDRPPLWLRSLDAEELQTLDFMRTQLLLPLFGRHGMAGILSLGPRHSGAAYSNTDIRLLGRIARQTAIALENSRLV